MIDALYLHIPFCDHICSYCDFPKVLKHTFNENGYVKRLIEEISSFSIQYQSLKTIYIGGGTPSALDYQDMEELLSYLHCHFPQTEEFTMECNPESLTEEKVKLMHAYGINRVSLGVQTVSAETLHTLNRHHDINDVVKACQILREHDIDNINLDFIYGLPSMTMEDLDKDIDFAMEMKPKHLSFYSLQIEEGTVLFNQKTKPASDEEYARMYEHVLKRLEENGYHRYEISNFSLPGYESKHNLTYWHDRMYYAAGLGAASYISDKRYTNTRSMTRYMNHDYGRTFDTITKESEEFEYLMLNLRLAEGFSLNDFEQRFHHSFLEIYLKEIEKVKDSIEIKDGFFRIKNDKLYIMDYLLLQILK